MDRQRLPQRTRLLLVLSLLSSSFAYTNLAQAGKLTLSDGRIVDGMFGQVDSVAEDPEKSQTVGPVDVKRIQVIDDGLRRLFVSTRRVRQVNEVAESPVEHIRINQRVAESGNKMGGVGPILRITPFDQFGRRIFTMQVGEQQVNVVQGITEITPVYTRVDGLQTRRALVWQMRIATGTIPRETLSKVLLGAIDPTRPDERLKIVRLYVQSERYKDAREELESIVADFPDLKELEAEVRSLRQMGARRLLKEIELRASAGQFNYALSLLESFPGDGVAGETLAKIKEIQADYAERRADGELAVNKINEFIAQLEDTEQKVRAEKIRDEIAAELNYNTLDRMSTFLRLLDDEKLAPKQKLSLALSGWLIGTDNASENLALSLSLYDVRQLIVKYLNSTVKPDRQAILGEIAMLEGSSVDQLAKLLAHMRPPLEAQADQPKANAAEGAEAEQEGEDLTPPAEKDGEEEKKEDEAAVPAEPVPVAPAIDGLHARTIPGLKGELDVNYWVQLPPEYDPHRHYPIIVTLNGSGTSPLQQIDWWAGAAPAKGQRLGQATRHGYIVLAVEWLRPHQRSYNFSAREHYAVLAALRDAQRRFSIDTDRVFLSGHSIGGDAAWDLALAHPDLWAGVIPVVAVADQYCAHYWQNATYVPMYVVAGEMDGDKMIRNARELDRYMQRGFDTTVAEFQGRGHEHFYDEIQHLFDWMQVRERNFYPKEIECYTMRPWDNFFWWIEADDFLPSTQVDPASWPPARGVKASAVTGKISDDRVTVNTASKRVSLWLTPELIDFQKRNNIVVNGKRYNGPVAPDREVILEDVRTRGDRLHPFWAKVDAQGVR
jgi:pimeloyl-ACP methyl ester carboxylesterase